MNINSKKNKPDKHNFFHQFFQNSGDSHFLLLKENFIDCNNTCMKMFLANSKEQILSLHPSELSPEFQPDGSNSIDKANKMMQLAYKNKSHIFGWLHRKLDGTPLPAIVSLTLIEEDGIKYLHAAIKDVSAKEKIESHNRTLLQGLEHSAVGILITDKSGYIEYVNEKYIKLTGFSYKDIIGKKPGNLTATPNINKIYDNILKKLETAPEWHGEIKNRRKNGDIFWASVSISPIHDINQNITNYILNFEDISERKNTKKLLKKLLYYDTLLNIPNRNLFFERLNWEVEHSEETRNRFSLIFININGLKRVNDSYGYQKGDILLKRWVERIQNTLTPSDSLYRLNGNEFAIIQMNQHSEKKSATMAIKIINSLSNPVHIDDIKIFSYLNIGIAIFGQDANTVKDLVKSVDIALIHSKEIGKNNYCFYSEKLNYTISSKLNLESSLHSAVNNNEFELFYQPKYDIKNKSVSGVEALLRWNKPGQGFIPASEFIPIAEESNIIIELGNWVLEQACWQQVAWAENGLNISMAVNVSPIQLHENNFVTCLHQIIKKTGIAPENLEIEITETAFFAEPEKVKNTLNTIRDMGVSIAIDDFGTGYSSLNYLVKYPISTLKIDRSFIATLLSNNDTIIVTETIISLAQKMKMKTVAEGVEEIGQVDLLSKLGCNIIQGYYYGRPQQADKAMNNIKSLNDLNNQN